MSAKNSNITNTSLKQITNETPVNFNRKPQLSAPDDLNETASPSVVKTIKY